MLFKNVSSFYALMRKDLTHEVMPKHYDLYIELEENNFKGTILMHLNAQEYVNSFRFNSKELNLSNLQITKNDSNISATFSEDDEFVTVKLEDKVKGDFTLSLLFNASYSSKMEGFYKSKYNENDLFSTHFEATDARKAFPCFVQPDMKATFSITIKAPENNIALSNNSLKEQNGNVFIFNKTFDQ